MRKTRPGGRTAQTRVVVFEAVEAILAEKEPSRRCPWRRSPSAPAWRSPAFIGAGGDVRTLMTEVAVERLVEDSPLPDTGSLRGDLTVWAASVAASLGSREGSVFFRVYVGAAPTSPEEGSSRAQAMMRRVEQIAAMLDRARARKEITPHVFEITDHLLAPLYMRALFGYPADAQTAEGLVTYLLDAVVLRSAT